MGQIDNSIFSQQKSILDQQHLQDAFNLQKAAQLQALQTGGIDAATKQNALKYQTIAQGAANGAQGLAMAKAKLGQLGIDSSEYSDDPAVASQQALTGQQVSSPYGTLFNAQQKVIGNNIAAAGAFGTLNNPLAQPSIVLPGQPNIAPQGQASPPPITAAPLPPVAPQPADQGSITIPTKQPLPIDGSAPVVSAPNVLPGAPIKDPMETQSAYNQRFEQYKASPDYIAASSKAGATGKNQADVAKNADESSQSYNQVVQTLDAIKQMAPDLPQQKNLIGPDTRAAYNQNFGDGKMADNYSKFQTINEAQTLGAIKELAVTGQIRMTRTLENIINRGFLVDPKLDAQGKIDQANAIQSELRNAAVAAQNTNANMNGGQTQEMTSPLNVPPNTVDPKQSLPDAFNAKKYSTPESIGEAFKSGKLTRDQAKALLQSQHGLQ